MKKIIALVLILITTLSFTGCKNSSITADTLNGTSWTAEGGSSLHFFRGGACKMGGTECKWEINNGAVLIERGSSAGSYYYSYVYSKEDGVEKLTEQTADGTGKVYTR